MKRPLCLAVLLLLLAGDAFASAKFKEAVKARIEKNYAVVLFANGTKTMVPLTSLNDEDRATIMALSTEHPLAAGKSSVTVKETSTVAVKKTIVTSTTVGPLETVQLCAPSVARDQIGGTCMLYGRVHWLDIAGYYVNVDIIYKTLGDANTDHPWQSPRYLQGLDQLVTGFMPKPIITDLPAYEDDPFDWARGELRKGRPILAAFPREIWQALPPGFIAAHPWGGGNVGHQIVVNGFTWNKDTGQGTFHIVNSWAELPEFDLKTEAAKGGALMIAQSLAPKGEAPTEAVKEVVKTITLVRAAGKSNLYDVETNLGRRKIVATSEEAARAMAENGK